jgi:Fe/S biogenesis protein NfuA
MLEITEIALEKIKAMMEEKGKSDAILRVAIRGRGPQGFLYQLGFVDLDNRKSDDTELKIDGVKVFVDPETVPNLAGSTLDLSEINGQQGFKIDNPNPLWNDPVSMKVQQVLDTRVNPSVAMHGGFVSLKEFKEGVAYVVLGGGCQGCGMAKITLSQGIDVMIKEEVDEVQEVIDATDHDLGTNPFYTPAKTGESPLAN